MTPRTRTQSRPTPLRTPQRAIGLFLGAAVLAVMLVAPSLVAGTFVARLTVHNATPFDLNVDVAGPGRDGWFDLGTVARETDGVLEEVADLGGSWVFRFSYAGFAANEVVISRAELRDAGWRVTIPATVGEELGAAGIVPSAR